MAFVSRSRRYLTIFDPDTYLLIFQFKNGLALECADMHVYAISRFCTSVANLL